MESLPSLTGSDESVFLSVKEAEPSGGFRLSAIIFHDSLISVHKEMCGDKVFFHVVNNLFNI